MSSKKKERGMFEPGVGQTPTCSALLKLPQHRTAALPVGLHPSVGERHHCHGVFPVD